MDAGDSNTFMAGCENAGVSIGIVAGRGRVLQMQRCADAGELLLSAPVEHQVEIPIPLTPSSTLAESSKLVAEAHEANDFSDVQNICSCLGSGHRPDVYWAALMSLTALEIPVERGWPCISEETQARLLMLFRPAALSFTSPLVRVVDTSVIDGQIQEAQAPLDDPSINEHLLLTQELCEHFALRVSASKVLGLVLVWMYNSFNVEIPPIEPNASARCALQLFVLPALCSHSCDPNCRWNYGDDGRFNIYVGEQGLTLHEELTISYLDEWSLTYFHTLQRREALAWSWLFLCECKICSRVTAPICSDCYPPALPLSIFSWEEKQIHPNSAATCRNCGLENLQCMHGYFFRCGGCCLDVCPMCALELEACRVLDDAFHGRPNVLRGYWKHRDHPEEGEELIFSDTLIWSNGGTSKVTHKGGNNLSIRVNGRSYDAEILDQSLVWSDGDVWIPCT